MPSLLWTLGQLFQLDTSNNLGKLKWGSGPILKKRHKCSWGQVTRNGHTGEECWNCKLSSTLALSTEPTHTYRVFTTQATLECRKAKKTCETLSIKIWILTSAFQVPYGCQKIRLPIFICTNMWDNGHVDIIYIMWCFNTLVCCSNQTDLSINTFVILLCILNT